MARLMAKHSLDIFSKSGVKEEEIEVLEIAAHFFLKELEKIKEMGRIRGEVQVVTSITREGTDEHLSGDMEEIPDYYLDNGVKKPYYICRIADHNNSLETLRTLAHELTHVWQTEIGCLKVSECGWEWRGKQYGSDPYTEKDNLPWETQADKLDIQLVKKFYKYYFQPENK